MLLSRATKARHARPSRNKALTVAGGTAAVLALDLTGAAPAAAHDRSFPTMLQQLRSCESGDNYGINTGNGYYGAYQFNQGTWNSVGGTGRPHQNPPHVQDEMATRLYESRGWSPWPSCSRSRGLHATTVERPSAGSAPSGHADVVRAEQGGIAVAGWAFDRENQPAPIEVHAYVDGRQALAIRSDQRRDDVAQAHGVGPDHGFGATVPAAPGKRHICLTAIGAGNGGDTSLGCYDVVVPRAPIGNVDNVQIVPDGVRISGWTLDQDTTAQPTQTHVYVDGRIVANVPADASRPDVAQAYGVPEARGFDVVVPAGSQVCAFAIDTTGQAGNTLLECREPSA